MIQEQNKGDKLDLAFSKDILGVRNLFADVAYRYDLMNDLMSCFLHRQWKKKLVSLVGSLDSTILDMACGTGDVSIYLKKYAKIFKSCPKIFACDFNDVMVSKAKDKIFDLNIDNINFAVEDAQSLSFENNFFDYYIISFGIRNIQSIHNALKEAHRVLKITGQFLCLEFFKPEHAILNNIYKYYLFSVLPKLGKIVVNKEYAYRYLAQTINDFYSKDEFQTILYDIGFDNVGHIDLFPGVASIFYGYKS